MSNIIAHKLLPRVAGVIFDAVAAYLISCIWSIIEVGLFSTHEILAKLLPGKSARDLFVFFFIYLSFRAICSLFLGVSLGQYLSGLGARGRGWWQLRLLAPVRVMCDFFDPLDLSQFKQRLTATELYLTSQKSAPLFSVIVIIFSLGMLPASGFLRQTHLSTQIKFSELSIDKKTQVPHSGAWRSNSFKFYGEFIHGALEDSNYVILPKYSLRSVAGRRTIIPEFYLYQVENKTWVEVSTEGRFNWSEFLHKVQLEKKWEQIPLVDDVPDNSGLAQLDQIKSNLNQSNSDAIERVLKNAIKQDGQSILERSQLRILSESFLSSFGVIFTEGELWHVGEESYFVLSDKENSILLSLNSLHPTIIRLHFASTDKAKALAHRFLKDWVSSSAWVFDYSKPFDLDSTSLDFFSALDYFPLTSQMEQNKALYDFWGGQVGAIKKRIITTNDALLKNLWIDSVQSLLTVERSKKTINPHWVEMLEDFLSGFQGAK